MRILRRQAQEGEPLSRREFPSGWASSMRTSPQPTSPSSWVRVPANSESAARNRYRHFLQRSLSCVSKAVLRPAQPDLSRDEWLLVCPTDPIQFKTRSGPNLLFSFEQGFPSWDAPRLPG